LKQVETIWNKFKQVQTLKPDGHRGECRPIEDKEFFELEMTKRKKDSSKCMFFLNSLIS
jgi:hypothetical protein